MEKLKNSKLLYTDEIRELQHEYYTRYYRDTLGLPNYSVNITARLNEEENDEIRLKDILDASPVVSGKVLIIGVGTGSIIPGLMNAGFSEIHGIEPDSNALEITRLKAQELGLSPENFTNGVAEKLKFNDEEFDFIYCFTVIEHVQDIKESMAEMWRVTKKSGVIYLATNNWNYPYEGHYKVVGPTFLGKQTFNLYLKLRGRPTSYLMKHVAFLTPRKMEKIFASYQDMICLRQAACDIAPIAPPKSIKSLLRYLYEVIFKSVFRLEKNLNYYLIKRRDVTVSTSESSKK